MLLRLDISDAAKSEVKLILFTMKKDWVDTRWFRRC